MATLTIRKLDDRVKAQLRVRAAKHGNSMEAEARNIITCALNTRRSREPENIGETIRRIFAPIGGVDLPEVPKQYIGRPRIR